MAVGPQIDGTTKSVIACLRCGTGFLKGPIGRAKPIPLADWRNLAPRIGLGSLVHSNVSADVVDDHRPSRDGRTPPQRSTGRTTDSGTRQVSNLKRLDQSEQQRIQRELMARLDDAFDAAFPLTGLNAGELSPMMTELITAFSRVAIVEAFTAYDKFVAAPPSDAMARCLLKGIHDAEGIAIHEDPVEPFDTMRLLASALKRNLRNDLMS